MTRPRLRRHSQKTHRARRALVTVGFVGAAVEGVRRFRHRRSSENDAH